MGIQEGQKVKHRSGSGQNMVPLATFLKREFNCEKIDGPIISYGQACQSKKGEDFTIVKTDCQRVPGDGSSTFTVFGVRGLFCNFHEFVHLLCGLHVGFFVTLVNLFIF